MHARLGYIMAAIVSLGILVSGCSGGMTNTGGEGEAFQFQGILLHENSILITESTGQQLPEGQLISLNFPEGIAVPSVGSLYSYEIDSALAESWPPQGRAKKIEEIRSLAGHTVISFDTGEAILQHLPQNAHLIDVRTAEEYEGGHISGAQNISVDQIATAILIAVPEKTDVIIVYCRSGNRSAQAGKMLEELGYKVILDAGGIIDYKGDQVKGREPGLLPGQL